MAHTHNFYFETRAWNTKLTFFLRLSTVLYSSRRMYEVQFRPLMHVSWKIFLKPIRLMFGVSSPGYFSYSFNLWVGFKVYHSEIRLVYLWFSLWIINDSREVLGKCKRISNMMAESSFRIKKNCFRETLINFTKYSYFLYNYQNNAEKINDTANYSKNQVSPKNRTRVAVRKFTEWHWQKHGY